MSILEKSIKEAEEREKQKTTSKKIEIITPKTKKITIPSHIKVLFDNLDKSISSVWGLQKDGKIKWDAKYTLWLTFKEWFMDMM